MTDNVKPQRSKGNPPMRVRHTDEMREQWHDAAEQAGVTYSDWVRDTLTAEARRVLGLAPDGNARVPTTDAPADCPHLAWVKGASGLLVCVQCRKPKALVDLVQT